MTTQTQTTTGQTVSDFITHLARIDGYSWQRTLVLKNRPLHITVCRADQGRVTSVMMELEGPSERFSMFMSNMDQPSHCRYLVMDNHRVMAHWKHGEVVHLVEQTLRGQGLL